MLGIKKIDRGSLLLQQFYNIDISTLKFIFIFTFITKKKTLFFKNLFLLSSHIIHKFYQNCNFYQGVHVGNLLFTITKWINHLLASKDMPYYLQHSKYPTISSPWFSSNKYLSYTMHIHLSWLLPEV